MAKKEEAKEKVATKEVAEKPASKSTKSTKSTKKAQPVIEVEPVEEKPKAKKTAAKAKKVIEVEPIAVKSKAVKPSKKAEKLNEDNSAEAAPKAKKTRTKKAESVAAEPAVVEEAPAKPARKRIAKKAEKVEIVEEVQPKPSKKAVVVDDDDDDEQGYTSLADLGRKALEKQGLTEESLEEEKPVEVKKPEPKMVEVEDDDDDDDDDLNDEKPKRSSRSRSMRGKSKDHDFELMIDDESASISTLTKGNVWAVDVDTLYNMLLEGRRTEHWDENRVHYMNIVRPVFDVQFVNRDDEQLVSNLTDLGFKVLPYPNMDENLNGIAIRKHQIKKITDLTHENIYHLSPKEVLHLIEENMGIGWKGLPLPLQDIIEAAFYVDSSELPAYAMHRAGGMIDRRTADGYEVLEIERGSWIEAVFLKVKPKQEKIRYESTPSKFDSDEDVDDDDEDVEETDDRDEDEIDDEPMEEEPSQIEDIDSIEMADDEDE